MKSIIIKGYNTRPQTGSFIIASLMAAAISHSHTAFAGRQIIPATSCQVEQGHANATTSIKYSKFGNIKNTNGNQRVSVVCPVPRLNQSHSANWVRVYFDDNNPVGGTAGQLGCRLRSNTAFGDTSLDSMAVSTSASGGTSSGFWTFTGVTAAGGNANYPKNYSLHCYLPKAYGNNFSSIGSIVIDEANSKTH